MNGLVWEREKGLLKDLKNVCGDEHVIKGRDDHKLSDIKKLLATLSAEKQIDIETEQLYHRDDLLDALCGDICPMGKISGVNPMDINDLDFNGKYYTYKNSYVSAYDQVQVGKGYYGVVYKISFTDYRDGNKYSYAMKRPTIRALDEVMVISQYSEALSCPGIIKMKLLDDVVVMPLADGDLRPYSGKLTQWQCSNVIKVLTTALLCMHEHDIYYFDIKAENTLFQCHSKFKTSIFLGDMGSIIPTYGKYIATFPPPGNTGHIDINVDDPLKIYTYQLSLLYCNLLTGKMGPHHKQTHVYYDMLETLVTATRPKLKGKSNKYIRVLERVIRDRSIDNIDSLNVFRTR
jgi:hypothetical protein